MMPVACTCQKKRALKFTCRWTAVHLSKSLGLALIWALAVFSCSIGVLGRDIHEQHSIEELAAASPATPALQVTGILGTSRPRGGRYLRVLGSGFGASASSANAAALSSKIGVTPCDKIIWTSATALKCKVAAGVGGALDVAIGVSGNWATLQKGFSYTKPVVLRVSPSVSFLQGDELLTITGKNFGVVDSHPQVFLGNTACRTASWKSDWVVHCMSSHSSSEETVPLRINVAGQVGESAHAVAFHKLSLPGHVTLADALKLLSKLGISQSMVAKAVPQANIGWQNTFLQVVFESNATAAHILTEIPKVSERDVVPLVRSYIQTVTTQSAAQKEKSSGNSAEQQQDDHHVTNSEAGSKNQLSAPTNLPPNEYISDGIVEHEPKMHFWMVIWGISLFAAVVLCMAGFARLMNSWVHSSSAVTQSSDQYQRL